MIERSENLTELFKALSKAQGEIRPALKDAVNPHLRSKYADLGSVWEACRQALASNGLSVTQWPVTGEGNSITLMTVLGHASGQFMMAAYTMPTGKGDAQGYGSALTYAKRYALSAVLGIVADDDDDGHAASQPPPRQQAPAQSPQPQQAPAKPAQPPMGTVLTPKQAQAFHERIGAILSSTDQKGVDHLDFAARVLSFKPSSFTDLTLAEAKDIQAAAEALPKIA